MIIGIPVYQDVDLLDVTGPHEVFMWMEAAGAKFPVEVQIIAEEAGEIATRDGFTFKATKSFKDVAALDVLWVPGGSPDALGILLTDPDRTYLEFLARVGRGAKYVCSVCEGALPLAASGLLDGFRATTHWAFLDCLSSFPVTVEPGHPRYVVDDSRPDEGIRVTGGGISSGLDEALRLVELLAGTDVAKAVQRITQYYPDPPVNGAIPASPRCSVRGVPPPRRGPPGPR